MKLGILRLNRNVLEEIKEGQKLDLHLIDHMVLINQGKVIYFKVGDNMFINLWDIVCVPDAPKLKKRILEKGHRNGLNVNPGATKMHQDIKQIF